MLGHKIQLFGVASICISTVCARRHLCDNNSKLFKKEATLGIIACGIMTALLPF